MQRHIQTTVHSLTLTASLLFVMSSFNPVVSAHAQEIALQPVGTTGAWWVSLISR